MTDFIYGLADQFGSSMWGSILLTFIVSMVPIVELRGALPLGVYMGLHPAVSLVVSTLGNMVPVPFILFFIKRIFRWLRKWSPRLERLVLRMEKKADKNSSLVTKYELVGLYILVAIPLPGTGAWTGALVAALLDMKPKKAFPAIFFGVLTAGIVVMLITYGVKALL